MSPDAKFASLANALPAEAWVPEDEHARYAVQGMTPHVGIRPATEDEAAAAMQLAAADAWCVVPWGSGSAQGRGVPPAQYDLCLSTERLTGVVEHYADDMVATIRAGMPLTDVQAALGAQGQWWPIDPPDVTATVGGILATNRSGPRRALYGTARDHVLGMRVLHADGAITKHGGKVVKNVAGFDLNKLHIGALGTLGIILEVSIKVRPVPTHETIVAAPFTDFAHAGGALANLAVSELPLTAIELLNEAAAQAILPAAAGSATALVAMQGPPTAVERQVRQVSDVLRAAGGGAIALVDRADVARVWAAFRDLGANNRESGADTRDTAVLWCTVATLPRHVGQVADAAQRAATDYGQHLLVDARAADGAIRLGLTGQPKPVLARKTVDAWREVATAHGGTLVVDRASENVRAKLDVWGPPRQDFALMQRLKQSFDPQRLLNRGRFVGRL